MIAYKAFQKDLSCLGVQYKETEWNYTERAVCRETGFHCVENPLDCQKTDFIGAFSKRGCIYAPISAQKAEQNRAGRKGKLFE